ncbi:MAG: zf-HC2 domain-containing protein [Gemmatimonadota bacterium]|nr:zf-HC2 domain-containing protein [Gemmatimonadota bacterium]
MPTSSVHLTEDQINDLVDGLLSVTERTSVTEHLAACADCRAEVAELSELVGIARADATLVVAPPQLEIVVLATTIHERFVRRHVVRVLHLPLAVGLVMFVMSSVALTAWILLACTSPAHRGIVAQCSEPWYFVVRDAARERYKEVRDEQRDFARKLGKNFRP